MTHFGGFLGLNSPKYYQILLKFSPEVAFKETQTVFEKFWKNSNFYRNERYPKFTRLVQLSLPFSPWRWPKSKKLNICRRKFSHRALQILQNQSPISSQLFRKNTISFCSILVIFYQKQRRGHKLKAQNQNLSYTVLSTRFLIMFLSKNFVPSTFQFCGYRCQRSFFLILPQIFKFGCFSGYHAHIFGKISLISRCRI